MRFCRLITAVLLIVLCGAGIPSQADQDAAIEEALRQAAAKVAPSVVTIETTGGSERVGSGRNPMATTVRKGVGPTTGVVVASDGFIITSSFNFANSPTSITVSVPGRPDRFVGKVVATDHSRMLTLLKIDAADLQVPLPMPTNGIQIGQWSVALGRNLDPVVDHPPSMSVGIISALGRIWGRCLQTDAKVSPVNYGGPLVNIDGRVFGILIPASPTGDGETAGFEWYDSGIGFAVPFEQILSVLPSLKSGKDLRRGLLGITPKGNDQFNTPMAIDTVAPESTAAKAGLKTGDVITEIDGIKVYSRAQAYHVLGPKYGGDKVTIRIKRGKEELTFAGLELMGSVPPFRHSFLGILPMRDDPELGVGIRHVIADSPAAKAGLKSGDRIMKFKAPAMPRLQAFSGRDQLREALDAVPAGSEVHLEVRSDGVQTKKVTLTTAAVSADVPAELVAESSVRKALEPRKQPPLDGVPGQPKNKGKGKDKDKEPESPKPAPETESPKVDDKEPTKPVEVGLLQRSSPARDRSYWVYVPANYDKNVSHGAVVWLHAAGHGGNDAKDVVKIWQQACEDRHLILIGPKSAHETGWLPSEAEFVQESLREVIEQYTIDRQRIVAHGLGIGGQMAYYLAFNAREFFRGAATSGAPLANPPKDSVAGQRLSFFIVAGDKDPNIKEIAAAKPVLNEKRFPVLFREVAEMGKEYLDRATFEELVRWIDSLDRL